MQAIRAAILAILSAIACGCASGALPDRADLIILVPGAGGGSLQSIKQGLADGGVSLPTTVFSWGAPSPLFMLNLQDRSIHNAAEQRLAQRIERWRADHPSGTLCIIAHSAGCGVMLGALARLAGDLSVDRVVLLAPSVSPGYDLAPALRHVRQRMDVFYSDRDTLWLQWRTGTFGTYDSVKTPAAGNRGFTSADALGEQLRSKLVQHAYQPAWEALGNDGGHFGWLATPFVARIVAPLLAGSIPDRDPRVGLLSQSHLLLRHAIQ